LPAGEHRVEVHHHRLHCWLVEHSEEISTIATAGDLTHPTRVSAVAKYGRCFG
jgi:hypothetical protein